uniref:High mobility group B protein 13 n=1 Tax=Anthurium amnicola TaxID=1678845 RepID=A0A1D1YJV2_9ARAE
MQSKKLEKKKHDLELLKSNFICQEYLLKFFPTSAKVKENTDGKFEDIFNILVAKWNNFSTEEQKLYLEKYQQDKNVSLQVVGQEEQVQKTMMELLQRYLQFREGMEIENREKK